MTVLHITNWRFRGGGTAVARALFDAGGEDALMLCLEDDAPRGSAAEAGPREFTCAIWDFAASGALIARLLERFDRIAIHSHGRRPGMHARLARARFGKRVGVVHSFHGIASFAGPKRYVSAFSESVLSYFTDALVAVAPAEVALFRNFPLGCALELIAPPYTQRNLATVQPRKPQRIGMSARLVQPKLHRELIDAVAGYNRDAAAPLTLVLAGDGPDADAIRAHGERLLGAHFVVLGHVNGLADFHASLDLFAFFSRFEGLPMALVDALACGLPCVATDVIGNNDVIQNERNGLLVPVGDVAAAVRAIARLCDDAALRERLGAAASDDMRKRYSPEVFWRKHAALYAAILGRCA